jgi:predicted nucleic acid-binding protein
MKAAGTKRFVVDASMTLSWCFEAESEHDASYIELALREGVPLATLDERLRHAASNNGVPLIRI